ncbi:hypothetical protein DYI20_01810 [Auritidibacter ignavus]|nr:hypothetical protein DCC25_08060 [Auritidibacter sp. NML120636]PXA82325.1 hypothetical protein DCC26_00750 [Auritidibacter sp. NML120779]RMX23893.1 hypothetical protein DYI20_01810 [Auritidibacter ignavus]
MERGGHRRNDDATHPNPSVGGPRIPCGTVPLSMGTEALKRALAWHTRHNTLPLIDSKAHATGAITACRSQDTGRRPVFSSSCKSNPGQALTRGSRIAAIGSLVGSLEELSRPADVKSDSLLAWRLRRTSLPMFQGRLGRQLDKCFEHPGYQYLVFLRSLAAIGTIIAPERTKVRTLSITTLTLLLWAKSYRGWYGSDGSDQMSFIVFSSGALAELMPRNECNATLLSSFVAFQSLLSYFASGVAKVVSPSWRDGSALKGIFRTQTYGDERFYRFLTAKEWRAAAMSRTVTAFEVLFPAVVLMPKTLRTIGLGIGAAFHIANARFMGLNRFFWAFCGTYPSIISVAKAIRFSWKHRLLQ